MNDLRQHDIEQHLRSARKTKPDARVFGFKKPAGRLDPSITQAGPITIDGQQWRIIEAPSELAIRHAMLNQQPGELLAIITPLNMRDLATDVRVRFPHSALFDFNPWGALKMLFAASELSWELNINDRETRALGSALLRTAYTQKLPHVTAGVLDLPTAWQTYFQCALSFQNPPTRLADWFSWAATHPGAVHQLLSETKDLHNALTAYLLQTIGPASKTFLATLAHGPTHPLTLGLVASAAWQAEHDNPALITAATSLRKGLEKDRYLGDQTHDLHSFAREARNAWHTLCALPRDVSERRETILTTITNALDHVLREETLEPHTSAIATYSPASRIGWQARLNHVAHLIDQHLSNTNDPTDDRTTTLKSVLNHVANHHLAAREPELSQTLKDAARLVFRLNQPQATSQPATDLASLANHYIDDLSFVDRLRESITGRDVGPALNPVIDRIIQAAIEHSDRFNQRFATDLARQLTTSTTLQNTLGIHQAITQVVAPVAAKHDVLLIVLDGLSWSVARSLLADPQLEAFNTWAPALNGRPLPMIAALPSVTAFSRTALLTGKLQPGNQFIEARDFQNHPDLTRAIGPHKKAVLFHKADLDAAGRGNIGPDVANALDNPQNRVVAVVVNAIDDQLAASEQITFDWTISNVTPLRTLLDRARERVIILVGDHGHVWETASTKDPITSAGTPHTRWRTTDHPPTTGELRFEGPMIHALTGERAIIAPYTERIRYTGAKRGYHGGASAQELVTPLIILTRGDTRLPNDIATPLATMPPAWWHLETITQAPTIIAHTPTPPPPSSPQVDLFAPPPPPPLPTTQSTQTPALIAALLQSEIFHTQLERFGTRLPQDAIPLCLTTIHTNRDYISLDNLAHVLALTGPRTIRFVTQLASVLNRDGYPVLEIDRTENTARLNTTLLKSQFML